MTDELNSYDLHEGPYANLDEEKAFNLFFNRTMELKRKYSQNIFFYEVSKQNQKNESEEKEKQVET
jgi:hypothetical protein